MAMLCSCDEYQCDCHTALPVALAEADRLRAALTSIAALNDDSANRNLAETGSYSGFDYPEAVRTARKALGIGPK